MASWKRPLGAPDPSLEPMLPQSCAPDGPATLRIDDTARLVTIAMHCPAGLVGTRLGVSGFSGRSADVVLRVALRDGRVVHRVLRPGEPTYLVPVRPSALDTVTSYLGLGLEHIATGFDHLLFLLGIVVFATGSRQLVGMVTAFTMGHAVTLSVAALGRITLPAAPIEMGIALTIVTLAYELTRESGMDTTLLQRRPASLTFGFGLLHGLGFAGALREVGLPDREVLLALCGFNGGIELGQLAFVLAITLLTSLLRGVVPQRRSERVALAYVIGSVAACLVIERAGLWFG